MAAAVMPPAFGTPLATGPPLAVDAGRRQLSSALELGRRKMLEGHFVDAIEHFSLALDLKPGLVHALVSRGCCYLSLAGCESKAQRDFAEVIAKDAGFNRNVYVLIALCYKRSGDFLMAIRYLSRCIAQFPTFKSALMARGELNLKIREYEKARADFRQVILLSPRNYTARRGIGDALRGLGDLREAEAHYTKAIETASRAMRRLQGGGLESDVGSGSGTEDAGNSSSEVAEGGMQRSSSDTERSFEASGGGAPAGRGGEDDDEAFDDDDLRGAHGGVVAGDTRPTDVPDALALLQDGEPVEGLAQLQSFIMEVLLRRALLLRIAGDLEAASADLLEVLQQDAQNGLALFWYGMLLIEQHRHKEAPAFLQASAQHHEETRAPALALLGALLVTRSDPDCEGAVRHLREAARINPSSSSVRITQWICAAAATLKEGPRDGSRNATARMSTALGLLDRALAALGCGGSSSSSARSSSVPANGRASPSVAGHGSSSARGALPTLSRGGNGPLAVTPRVHIAGSGGAAVVGLGVGATREESIWNTARGVVKRREQLAQGDDLDVALSCSTFLQLVAKQPSHQAAQVPPLLYALRAVALSELGRYEEVCADCRKALAVDPDDEATQYNMHIAAGILRSRASEFEAAIGKFTKAVRLRPVSAEARVHRAIALTNAARAHATAGGAARDSLNGNSSARAAQLLSDAVQDLQAAEQQAIIEDAPPPVGVACLRAACLCGLGRLEEAWEILQQTRALEQDEVDAGGDTAAGFGVSHKDEADRGEKGGSRGALEAEVLMLLGRYTEAIEACNELVSTEGTDVVTAHLMRSRCWGELGETESAFEDCREALIAAPERAEIHEASGDLFLVHGCYNEAITAFNTAAKLRGSLPPRLAYLRALAQLALGSASLSLKDLNRALRLNPNLPAVIRARDGIAALQMVLEGDFRYAHVRLNVLVHAVRSPNVVPMGWSSSDSLPLLFQPHELVLYRGVCAFYLGDASAAVVDFEASLELARHLLVAESAAVDADATRVGEAGALGHSDAPAHVVTLPAGAAGGDTRVAARQRRLPPEVASQEGLARYESEMLFNITLCHLVAHDYRTAQESCERLLQHQAALASTGANAQCLAWFLLGVCRLALGEARSETVREAFMQSYAYDPVYVDDFLRRHEPREERTDSPGANVPTGSAVGNSNGGGGGAPLRRVGAPVRPGGLPKVNGPPANSTCDIAPEAVVCLRRDRSALGARLPPKRIQVKDVVIWCRVAAAWPFVRPPDLTPSPATAGGLACWASLARPDFLPDHQTIGVTPVPPWDT